MQPKIGISILNYKSYEDAITAVESLANQTYRSNIIITIVDNCSPNDSYKIIKDRFKDDPTIEVIKTKENLGVARGHNIGFKSLLERGATRIFLSNPDVIFSQPTYFETLAKFAYSPAIAMIGTTIDNVNSSISNPMPVTHRNRFFFRKELIKFLKRAKNLVIKKPILSKLKKTNQNSSQHSKSIRVLDPYSEMLHASGIYFTENYFKKYDQLCPLTFIYSEEDILALFCQRAGLKQLFNPSLRMTHVGGGSTKNTDAAEWARLRAKYQKDNNRIIRRLIKLPLPEFEQYFISSPDSAA